MRVAARLLVLSACLFAACGKRPGEVGGETISPPPASRSVNVYNWPDYIAPGLIQQFEAETGIKVNYDSFDSLEMLETRMLTGNSGYDVVVPSGPFLRRMVEAGVYRPLDRSRLANYGNLDPEMMAMLDGDDPGSRHAVGYMWGTTGIGHDARKVSALAPDAPVDSWRLVFDPGVAKRLAACGIAFVDAPSEILAVTLMSLGKDPYSSDPADPAAAEAALLAIRPYVRYVNSVPIIEDFAGGNLCVVVSWSGDMLRADIGAANATSVRYATFNRAALPLMDSSLTGDPAMYPPPAVRARLRAAQARSLEDSRTENRIWTRFRTGQ